ncbi:MAG: hypothetical protein AMJ81_08985 [Phycisphaerae bacterium SM23_33]|nr:MAG: hypothetical protein AMJ81_08985 [Phycisphaerae bacterium SM23_33]
MAACILPPALAPAGQGKWESIGIGGGGGIFVPSSSPHDPKLIFCASDMSGVYRSTDGGRTWRMLHWRQLSSAISCAVAFDPSNENVLYCVPGPYAGQVLKVSRDKGLTWQPLCDGQAWEKLGQVGRIDVSPDGKILFLATAKGSVRSDDGGKTWTQVKGIETTVHRFFFPRVVADLEAWYVGTVRGVFGSYDRGRTWNSCGPIPGEKLHDFCGGADSRTGRAVLYCSVPGRDDSGKFAGGIFRSEDRGATWQSAMGAGINTSIGRHGPIGRTVPDYPFLGMAANQTDTVYTFGYGTGTIPPYSSTVYRTDDGGRSWKRVLAGPRYAKGRNVELSWINYERGWSSGVLSYSVNPRHKDVLHYSTGMEIFVTYDGGRRWRQAYTRFADRGAPDRGKRWSGVGLEMTTTWRFVFDPHDRNRCYICYTDIGFARSLDRGKSWYNSPTGSPWSNTFYDIAFDRAKPGLIYAACAYEHDIPSWKMAGTVAGGGGVCISTDYGKLWHPSATGMPAKGACTAVELDPKSPPEKRTLYAAMYGGGVYKSTDAAGSWKPVNTGLKTETNDHFTDLKLHADGTLFALCGAKSKSRYEPAAYGGLFKSTDGGESWADLTEQLKLYLPYGFDVHPTDSRIIYLCVSAVPRRHETAGVYKSTDGGSTWTKLKIDWPAGGPSYVHAKYPSVDPYRPQRVWVSTGTHGLLVTNDGGLSWKEIKGVPFGGINRVTVDPLDHETIWCSSFGGGIWRGPAMGAGE